MRRYHVVLCGGHGKRLWPLSRENYPKPILPVLNGKSLLFDTVDRHQGLVDQTVVVTNRQHVHLVQNCVSAPVIVEPMARNTLAAIALAVLATSDSDALFMVTPSDHCIGDVDQYQAAVNQAMLIAETETKIVLFGVTPTRPDTGFGYLEMGEAASLGGCPIVAFHEKPDAQTAERYVNQPTFFWNSGLFCFSKQSLVAELERCQPAVMAQAMSALKAADYGEQALFIQPDCMAQFPDLSIDYGIMEHSANLVGLPVRFDWQDVGSLRALGGLFPQTDDGNFVQSGTTVMAQNSRGNSVACPDKVVALNGIHDAVIVDTGDALLISQDSDSVPALIDSVRTAYPQLKQTTRWEQRPWGRFDVLVDADGYKVKKITVNPGGVLSLQYHHHREEHWVVVAGVATIEIDDACHDYGVSQTVFIPTGATHRLTNKTDKPVVIIETQLGSYLGEDDIVRVEDVYGR